MEEKICEKPECHECSTRLNACMEFKFVPYPQSNMQWPQGHCHTFLETAVTHCRENETEQTDLS